MRNIALTIALSLVTSVAMAFGGGLDLSISGVDTRDGANAGARFGGSSSVSSVSHSNTHGNGYSVNYGGASSHQYGAGFARTGEPNSYEAGIDLRNTTQTYSFSKNIGSGTGYSDNRANAESRGRLGGEASSRTFEWEAGVELSYRYPYIRPFYNEDTLAHAHSEACGHLSASSNSHSKTGDLYGPRGRPAGNGAVDNVSWGDAHLFLDGHAATTPTAASALANADIWTDTGSISKVYWGTGRHVHGSGDAEAAARLLYGGNVGDNPCNQCGGLK